MVTAMRNNALEEIQLGISLSKCQLCGCMRDTLDQIHQALPDLPEDQIEEFRTGLPNWQAKMAETSYVCLGCDPCYAGLAQTAFMDAFPQVASSFGLGCLVQANSGTWPPVVGEYYLVDPVAPVAVVTLASLDLPKQIAERRPSGLCLAGKLETENIGMDKLVKNVIANPSLRCLIITGQESAGHLSGQTILALAENGIDKTGRVIGSRGKRPILRNVTQEEVETFRRQVTVVDFIGCEDVERITGVIEGQNELLDGRLREGSPCGCAGDT